MILYLWDAPGPACTARGVTGTEACARQAAEALLIGGQATDAVLEKAFLGLGAGSMTYGYQRPGRHGTPCSSMAASGGPAQPRNWPRHNEPNGNGDT